ncbi:MAG TPA: YibE/F family protein [Streptomyces sp.]|nr:YibE/F family protein [Streptomyces sp.]
MTSTLPHAPVHGHTHGHGPAAPVSRRLRTVITAVLVPFAAAVVAGLVLLWPAADGPTAAHLGGERSGVGFDRPTVDGRVTAVRHAACSGGAETCTTVTVRVTGGHGAGHTFRQTLPPGDTRDYPAGSDVVVAYAPDAPPHLRYSVIDVDRDVPLLLLAALFAVVVVVIGRLRGLLALAGLAVSFVVLTLFILPAILQGSNPLIVAVVGGSAIMLTALYLCHGPSARTSVAVLGTLTSLFLIGVLGSLFIDWTALTGNTDDRTGLVHSLYPGIETRGLLLAGVLIGSLGVLDDVTVTQTSAVWELKEADPSAGRRTLYRAAMRIGRDHIASVVNTLVLAYAGAALPLLLLFTIARSSVATVAGSELVAEEIVRTLVGSVGLVAAVPVTTLLAVLVVCADRPEASAAVTSRRGRRRKTRRSGARGTPARRPARRTAGS